MTEADKEWLHMVIGENIRRAREKANLKQESFATAIGLSRASIINIEKGRQSPSLYLLWEICKTLNISIQDVFPKQNVNDASLQKESLVELDDHIVKVLEKHFSPKEESMENVKNFIISSGFQ
jgi:DNA-binding XRE family transcriptional regulator